MRCVHGRAAGLFAVLAALALLVLPRDSPFVTGLVREEAGPVAGACVRWQGTSLSTHTDHAGRFALPRANGALSASKPGWFIAHAAAESPFTLTLRRLPAVDAASYEWVDPTPNPQRPQNCGNCHEAIYREWSASSHARAARNPHLRQLYDGSDVHGRPDRGWNLLADHPDGAGVCAACHAPTHSPWEDLRQVCGVAAHGVHCDYCHKVADVVFAEPGLTHGRDALKILRPAEGQLFFGPLDDATRDDNAFSPLYRDSRYCAACHEGVVFGVPVYTTYSEWLVSPARRAGQHCQACHQAPSGHLHNVAPGHGGLDRDPATLANHVFFTDSHEAMLRRSLRLEARRTEQAGETCVDVELVATDVGHRVPTGFVDRNLVLVVEALGDGLALRSGPVLPAHAGAAFAGLPGRLFAKQLRGFDGTSPAPFWRADPALTDTRLHPGRVERSSFVFTGQVRSVRVRLVHHRFWADVAKAKGWQDNAIVVVDRTLDHGLHGWARIREKMGKRGEGTERLGPSGLYPCPSG